MQDMTRRVFVATSAFVPVLGHAAPAAAQGATTTSMEAWMEAWMVRSRHASGVLHLSRFADPIYFLLRPISWRPNPGQERYAPVTVPTGFVTDFASIPRVFWSLLRPDGLYTYPAIVHDYLYWEQSVPREAADDIFRFGMEDFRVDTATIATIDTTVRTFGRSAWEENTKSKIAGQRRVLTRFPDDPTITWEQWKGVPSNFAG